MATLNIRNLPDPIHSALRVRAARRGNSMEAEARLILAAAVENPDDQLSQDAFERKVLRIRETAGVYLTSANPGGGVVDEFIAERRAQARSEAQD